MFRSWCAKSIDALAAMGVNFRFSDKERRELVKERQMSSWEIADEMLVNNTIVDSQIALSDALSRSLTLGDVRSSMRCRQFHGRLLWELQEHFEESIRKSEENEVEAVLGHGPASIELIALCILSFPSLSIDVKEDNEVEQDLVTSTRDWCGIQVGCGSEGTAEVGNAARDTMKNSALVIVPVCGPQRCEIQVRFVSNGRDRRKCAKVSLWFGDEKEFVWEWWRDTFTGRLEGTKEWQGEHYMETSLNLITSPRDLDTQFEKFKTITNEEFDVWKRWKPFRVEICMFELRRSEVLKEIRRVERQAMQSMKVGNLIYKTGFSKQKRRAVSYEKAKIQVIFHGMNLIRESMEQEMKIRESDVERGSEDGEESMVKKLLETAGNLSGGNTGAVERAVLLYEAAAGEFGSEDALERGVELVLQSASVSDVRAVELIQMFIGSVMPSGNLIESKIHTCVGGAGWSCAKSL